MNIGDIHANFCAVNEGNIRYTDYSDYRQNSHLYADPNTKLVDMNFFKRTIVDLKCKEFWCFLEQMDKTEIRSVNICPNVQVDVNNSTITRLPCDTSKKV